MGQQITVTRKEATRPGVVVFELNRSLTGMGHERYRTPDVTGVRPVDELARRLFAEGVKSVHVYSNVVTVEVDATADTEHLADVIRELFTYYREGVEVVDPMVAPAS
ncbi:MAG: NifU N-terminal domain-containing protein [Actinomycetota bacterium]|nr:NifU N-terminal domain-containing protein [Actinomycetota bacterium]